MSHATRLRLITAIAAISLSGVGQRVAIANCIVPPSDMVGWWPLDETSGTTAWDYNPNGFFNNGTYAGTPTWVPGKVGNALRFNGTTDGVRIVGGPRLCHDFTMDAWILPHSFPTEYTWNHGAVILNEYEKVNAEEIDDGILSLLVRADGRLLGVTGCPYC